VKKDPKKKKNPEDKEKRGRKPKEMKIESVFLEPSKKITLEEIYPTTTEELNTEDYIQVTTGGGNKIKVAKRKT
jgi:hypothetical protein